MSKTFLTSFGNFLDWDVSSYLFNRPLGDSKPYKIVRDEKKSTIYFNAVGVSENDVKVEIIREHGNDFLLISGDSRNEKLNQSFTVSGRFQIDAERVNDIDYSIADGILCVDVNFKEPEPSKIKITKK